MLSRRCCLRYRTMTIKTTALRTKSPATMNTGRRMSENNNDYSITLSLLYYQRNKPSNMSVSLVPILFSFRNFSLNHKSTGPLPCTASSSIFEQSIYYLMITAINHIKTHRHNSLAYRSTLRSRTAKFSLDAMSREKRGSAGRRTSPNSLLDNLKSLGMALAEEYNRQLDTRNKLMSIQKIRSIW